MRNLTFKNYQLGDRKVYSSLNTYSGFTLLELLIVISILSLITLAVIPDSTANNTIKVDLAAERVAVAIRFTRSEAIRTGIAHGIIVDHDNSEDTGKALVIYQIKPGSSPFSIDHIVNQPVSKQPYDIDVVDQSEKLDIVLRNNSPAFSFDTVGASQHLHFDGAGQPVYYLNALPHRLLDSIILIGNDVYQSAITVSTITGQVAVQ